MDDFDPMRYGFQDCAFLDMDDPLGGAGVPSHKPSLAHASDYSSNSSLTPSPQEILSANFTDDWTSTENQQMGAVSMDHVAMDPTSSNVGGINGGRTSRPSELSSPEKFSSCTSDSEGNNQSPLFGESYENNNYVMSQMGGPDGNYSSAPQWYQQNSSFMNAGNQYVEPQVKQEPISPKSFNGQRTETTGSDGNNSSASTGYNSKDQTIGSSAPDSCASSTTAVNTATTTPLGTISDSGKQMGHTAASSKSKPRITKPRKEKASHNMIEKRYRTNINQKILALRNCVPSLRCAVGSTGCDQQPNEDLEGLTPASKLNKATVLTKATEYIMHLQSRNAMLLEEVAELRRAVNLNQVAAAGAGNPQNAPVVNMAGGPSNISPVMQSSVPNPNYDITPRQNTVPKAMMYTMAGLMTASSMIGGGAGGMEDTRALYALPLPLPLVTLLSHMRLLCIFTTLIYFIWPLFGSNPPPKKLDEKAQVSGESLQRQTWLTVSSNMRLPPQDISVIQALIYVAWTCFEVLVSFAVGLDGHRFFLQMFGGTVPQDTFVLRAMDSQLCGGDENCSRMRLLVLFLRSFLISPNAKRFLMQSLQIRIILGEQGWLSEQIALRVSKFLWHSAGKANDIDNSGHLTKLLDHDYDDVMSDRTIKYVTSTVLGSSISKSDDSIPSSMSITDRVALLYAVEKLESFLVEALQRKKMNSHEIEDILALCPENEARLRTTIVKSILASQPLDPVLLSSVELSKCSNSTKVGVFCAEIMTASDSKEIVRLVCKDLTGIVSSTSAEQLGIFGFAALYGALLKVQKKGLLKGDPDAEKAAALARVWIGSEFAEKSGLELLPRRTLVGKCVLMSAHFGGIELDEGYSSY